jgi:CheY-like chemotaxis protein
VFGRERFDLVITDYELPFLKGDELASRIKQLAPQQPILMITAYAHRRSRENPVDVVVSKPFDSTRLRDAIGRLLSKPDRILMNAEEVELHGANTTSDSEIVSA